ncbi:GTP pyrophosphokinase [Peribacillus sp. NPDC096540]|uniref:GTP pyrophosphokinase n=1 Tax=Peribacillus sp. NPDC096540 TaxID=3390612 RepID=UPI003D02BEA2
METNHLKTQYDFEIPKYRTLCKEIIKQLEILLKENDVKLAVPINYRVKEWSSLLDKCKRYSMEPNDITEINDLAGIRIITLFEKDIKKVQEIINSIFSITREEDTASRLSDNQFGYGSIHYEIYIPDDWTKLPSLRELEGLKVEVQLRTISQHTWAAASHVLNYKKESDVPKSIIRSINRVAALLEVVDLEFGRVLEERMEFNKQPIKIDDNLNTDILEKILDEKLPVANKHKNENYSSLISELSYFSINDVAELENLIDKHKSKALKNDKVIVRGFLEEPYWEHEEGDIERAKKGVFFNHTGLLREIIEIEYGQEEKIAAMK